MLGFKRFAYAVITLSGIELVHQIKKGQFDVSALCSPQARTPQVWAAVLVVRVTALGRPSFALSTQFAPKPLGVGRHAVSWRDSALLLFFLILVS